MKTNIITICWAAGAAIWCLMAYQSFSEGKTAFAFMQILCAVLFILHAIRCYKRNKKK